MLHPLAISCPHNFPCLAFAFIVSLLQSRRHSKEIERESFDKERVKVGTESESREQKQTEEGRSGKGEKWRMELGGGRKGNERRDEGVKL